MSPFISSRNVLKDTPRGVQSVNIEDYFLDSHRTVFLTDEINSDTCSHIIEQILYLQARDSDSEIKLLINSPGGNVSSGTALYDVLKSVKNLTTVCIGTAASMGAIVFLAGSSRLMLPHTRVMIHDPSFASLELTGCKPHEIQHYVDSLTESQKGLAQIIATECGKSMDEILQLTRDDHFFTSSQALEFGIATQIINSIDFKEDSL